jgi:hypothetical protein
MDNISITRISDLPDLGQNQIPQNQMPQQNIGIGQGQGQGQLQNQIQGPNNTYQPMLNVHPNPYGIAQPQSGGLPPPLQTQEGPKIQQNIMYEPPNQIQNIIGQAPTNRLPQRDIPMMQEDYTHDEQIQPNYIPKQRLTRDYIDEYQNSTDRKIKEYEDKKRIEKTRETWFDEIRIPVIIGILFFIFQMPIINTLIFKRFAFLSIYSDDGNFNISGLFLKSLCFGSLFWILNRGMDYISEI